jgi:hypothetical protein
MTITLDVPKKLERELTTEAARLGIPVEQYALRLLSGGRSGEQQPRSGAELVEYWRREGIIGSRPDIIDSVAHARQIRRDAEKRVGS